MPWQIQWKKYKHGCYWARKPESRVRTAREWHWVKAGNLRKLHGKTPAFDGSSWIVKWNKRKEKQVLARNPKSKMASARAWHWVEYHTLERAGIKWVPKVIHTGRSITDDGYVVLTGKFLCESDRLICDKFKLWMGAKYSPRVLEHRLIACKKFGGITSDQVVRHINGIKDDNRACNLVMGTSAQNTADHNRSRIKAMYWSGRYIMLRKSLSALICRLKKEPKDLCSIATADMIKRCLAGANN